MIAKITRGGGFRGAARYVLDERHGLDHEHQPEIIGGNMAGRTSAELTREFEAVRQQRPDIRKPVEHLAVSFARDERPLSNDEMARLADEYLTRRGHDLDRLQYVVVRHRDKEQQHCHILLNRVRTDRTVVPQQWREYVRNKETCRALERDFGLRPVRNERSRSDRAPTRGEDRMARDRGLVSEKEQLKALIRDAAKDAPTMSEFVRRLQAKGVQVRANIARTGHVSGISYRLDRVAVKGSGLGRAYSFEGLQKEQGVRYDRARDLPVLERRRSRYEGARAATTAPASGSAALARPRPRPRAGLPGGTHCALAGAQPGAGGSRSGPGGPERRGAAAPGRRPSGRPRHPQGHRPFARQVNHERRRQGSRHDDSHSGASRVRRGGRRKTRRAHRGGAAGSTPSQGNDRGARRRRPAHGRWRRSAWELRSLREWLSKSFSDRRRGGAASCHDRRSLRASGPRAQREARRLPAEP